MYEELIRRLWECVSGECFNCSQYTPTTNASVCQKELMTQAADAIEKLSNAGSIYGKAWTLGYDAGRDEHKPRWIPVTERLPEEKINQNTADFEPVLCATIWGDVRAFSYGAPFGHKDAHFWNGNGIMDKYVTHWMPLPEPPKEES